MIATGQWKPILMVSRNINSITLLCFQDMGNQIQGLYLTSLALISVLSSEAGDLWLFQMPINLVWSLIIKNKEELESCPWTLTTPATYMNDHLPFLPLMSFSCLALSRASMVDMPPSLAPSLNYKTGLNTDFSQLQFTVLSAY